MAIVYEGYGNLLTTNIQTTTCPVNVVGVMGAGLARAFRNRTLGLNEKYKQMCHDATLLIGEPQTYHIPESTQQILLFPTKGHWKENSNLSDIEEGLKNLAERVEELEIESLAIGAIGCGLGGLDFTKEVKPLIVKYLDPLDIEVSILLRDD